MSTENARLTISRTVVRSVPFVVTALIVMISVHAAVPRGHIVAGGDAVNTELNPDGVFWRLLSLWASYAGFGTDAGLELPTLWPFAALDFVLHGIGVPDEALNLAWVIIPLIAISWSTIALFRVLVPRSSVLNTSIVGLIAFLNPYVLVTAHAPYTTSIFSIALIPAAIALAVRYLSERSRWALLAFFILTTLIASGDHNFGIFIAETALLGVLAVWGVCCGKASRVIILVAIYAAVHLPYVAMVAHAIVTYSREIAQQTQAYSDDTLEVTSRFSHLGNSIRLVGEYVFFNRVGDSLYIPSGPRYASDAVIVAATSTLPFVSFLAPLVAFGRLRRVACFVLALLVAALFGVKGTSPPFGSIFDWLYHHVFGFAAFRDSYNKLEWIVLFAMAFLTGIALEGLRHRFPRVLSNSVAIALLVATATAGEPIYAGQLFWKHAVVSVPPSYKAAAAWLNERDDTSKVVELPMSVDTFEAYRWGYVGAGIAPVLVNRPFLSPQYRIGSLANEAAITALRRYKSTISTQRLAATLGLFSIGYVWSDRDQNPAFFGAGATADTPIGERVPGLYQTLTDHNLVLSTVEGSLVNSDVYTPRDVYVGPHSIEEAGLLCGAIGTCRGTGIVPPDIAAKLGVHPGTVSFAASSRVAPSLARDPLIQVVRTSPSKSVGAAGIHRFVDFGNATIEATPSAERSDLITYAGARPVALDIVDTERPIRPGAFVNRIEDEHGKPLRREVHICPANGSGASRTFSLEPSPGTELGALALVYRTENVRAKVLITSANPGSNAHYLVPLGSAPQGRAFVRLFRPVGKTTLRVFVDPVMFADPVSGKACLHIAYAALATGPSEGRRLSGSAGTLSETTAYIAAHPRLFDSYQSSFRAHYSGKGKYESVRAALSDISQEWGDPDLIAAPAGPVRPEDVRVAVVKEPGGSQALRAVLGPVRVAFHVSYSHLLPGAHYRCSFGLATNERRTVRGIVLSDQDTGIRPFSVATSALGRQEVVDFVVPSNASGASVYLYMDGTVAAQSVIKLGTPHLELIPDWTSITIRRGEPLNIRGVQIRRISASSIEAIVRSDRPVLIILNETYSRGWKASAPKDVQVEHFRANIFGNGWVTHGRAPYVVKLSYDGGPLRTSSVEVSIVVIVAAFMLDALRRRREAVHDTLQAAQAS